MRKALVLIPDSLEKVNGFLNGCHALTRVLRSMGFTADVVAHYMGPEGLPARFRGLYRNVYYPRNQSPLVDQVNEWVRRQHAAVAGQAQPDWTSNYLFPAAVLASLGDYDLYVVHHLVSDWVKHYLPADSKKLMFAHYFKAIEDGDVNKRSKEEIDANLRAEIEPCWGYDLVTVTGERDRKLFLKYRPEAQVVHLPHYTSASPARALAKDGRRVVMTGFDNRPNRMALDWFYARVYPALHAKMPAVEVHITSNIGAYAKQRGYDKRPGTVIHGYVPDIAAVYRQCDVLVAPIFHSEGVKTRIFEAMGFGIPVVTTSKGLTNTRLRPGRDVLVGDSGPEMARVLARALKSQAVRQTLQRNGYRYIRQNHDIAAPTFKPLKKAILALVSDRPARVRTSTSTIVSRAPASRSAPAASGWVTENLERLLPWVIDHCRMAGYTSVAVFGAGSHTRTLVPMWRAMKGPRIAAVLTNLRPDASRIDGVRVMTARQFDPGSVDAIVISSATYEAELRDSCRKQFPGVPVLTIWAPQDVSAKTRQPRARPAGAGRGPRRGTAARGVA